MFHTFRFRFLLLGILIAVACSVVFFGLWQPKVERTFSELEHAQAQRQLSVLGNALIPYLLQNQIGAVHEVLRHAENLHPEWMALRLTDSAGQQLYPLGSVAVEETTGVYRMTEPIPFGASPIGELTLMLDVGARYSVLGSQVVHLGLVMMTVLMISGIGTLIVIDRMILSRIAALSEAARQLSDGDYSADLPRGGRDEIGRLVESFAGMRETIRGKERSLVQARDLAENAVDTKTRFLATMSHEIRTPLNGILPVADLLLDSDITQEQREQLNIVRNAGRTLKSVIDDILDISKLEAGEVLIRCEEFDLATTVESAVSVLSSQARARGVDLRVEVSDAATGKYLGDGERLSQVLINLVGNAVKFTDEGWVEVRVLAEEDALRFEVSDTGIGIAEADQERIFERFAQVDSQRNRKFSGSGLGLAISAALVEAMDGRLRLESTVGEGSTFWFVLPLNRVTAMDLPGVETPRTIQGQASDGGVLTVLIVDDSRVNLTVADAMLRRLGHKTQLATSGREAIEMVRAGGVDLVLMDQHMPEMDGIEATRRIRSLPAPFRDVMISGLTASIFAEDVHNCLAAGMDEFLAKPITRQALGEVLAMCQAQKNAPPQAAPDLRSG